jgi:hypothetical protein
MLKWTDEAVRAALSQAKAGRFSNMTAEEAMREILCAAWAVQDLTSKPAAPATKSMMSSKFDVFWAAYPCKKGKALAEKAFKKVSAEYCSIMAGLEQYKRCKPDYADWMHPSTFLNQRRWEDEYEAPQLRGRTYDTRKDGLALLLNEANRREADVGQSEVAGNIVQLIPRADMERGDDEGEARNVFGGSGNLF